MASRFAKASPNTAPRPWPTCIGPVGLAETYSTLTGTPPPLSLAPYCAPDCTAPRRDPGRGLEREIDEARAGDIDLGDDSIGAQFFGNRLGELARLAAGVLGQHHGGVGGNVAMRRIARRAA